MSNKYVTMNSVTFRPTEISRNLKRAGDLKTMADGTNKMYHRGFKYEFDLTWTGLPESNKAAIRTIATLTTSFTFIDEDGTSYTVLCPPDAYSDALSASNISIGLGIIYYDITLKLLQV
jgi:hypothetical protein